MDQVNTMKEILDQSAEAYGEIPAIRYKKKKEILSKNLPGTQSGQRGLQPYAGSAGDAGTACGGDRSHHL